MSNRYIPVLAWLFLLACPFAAKGQQCVSQGDAIVHIDFGAGTPDFGIGTTTYRLVQGGHLSDGDYTIASNIQHGRPEWHNLGDASDDPDGMMLVVNASHDPGEFYRMRVDGLCADTRFTFMADIANANHPDNCGPQTVLPRVRFVMEDLAGNIVGEYSTGNMPVSPTPRWEEYSFSFNTGNQHSFYLVLINDNPGGCGNDLAIDNIRFAPCGPEVQLSSAVAPIESDVLYYCSQQTTPIPLEGVFPEGGDAGLVYQWETRQGSAAWQAVPNETNRTISVSPVPGVSYRLTVAATPASMAISGCRFASPAVTLEPATDASAFGPGQTHGLTLCEGSEHAIAQQTPVPAHYGQVAGIRWEQYRQGAWEEVSRDAVFQVPTANVGAFQYRHVVEMACGDDIVTDHFGFLIQEFVTAALDLDRREACVSDAPIPLSGGSLSASLPGLAGEYSGPGVSNGMFDPSVAGPGVHTITFGVAGGYLCSELALDSIEVAEPPAIAPMPDLRIRQGGRIRLDPETDGTEFHWTGGTGLDAYDVRNPVASPTVTTTYSLEVRNTHGCVSMDTVTVIVLADLDIPNAFSPNGDGVNDEWQIGGLEEYTAVSVRVFNRWGNLVFRSDGPDISWNGSHQNSPLPSGTYYYIITSDQLYEKVAGSVTILR